MKTAAMIPIKLNSERMPEKNIKQFSDGKALVTVFMETLVQVKELDEIYVFCSNERIKDYMVKDVIYLKRPEYLDTADATPQDIISEFMKLVDADIYAVCHCTSPFVKAEHISECIRRTCSRKYDSAFTAERVQRLMWHQGKPLNFDAANVPRTQDLPVYYNEVSAAYVFKKEVFTKMKRRIGLKPYIMEVSGVESIDIDYPEDFEIANAVYMNVLRCKRGGIGEVK